MAQSPFSLGESVAVQVASDSVEGIKFADAKALKEFYDQRSGQPLWGDHAQALLTLAVLDQSWTQGLNPDTYHVKELHDLLDDPIRFRAEQPKADLMLSDAVIRYGHDVSGMRFNPVLIDQRAEYWRRPAKAPDVLRKVAEGTEPARVVAALAPHDSLYLSLRKEMERISKESPEIDKALPMDFGKGYFRPRGRSKAVTVLRERLGVPFSGQKGKETYYDDKLSAAVMAFQKHHNLKPDGIIGGKTLTLLNQTRRDRMEQLVANLERLRWLDDQIPSRYVLVNIPSQTLWAVDDGKIAVKMPVVVGKPDRPTKAFKATVTGVRFNPTWTVPPGIKTKDMLPKLQDDPNSLTDTGIELISGYGADAETIDPTTVDWQNISASELNQIRMVQSAGAHNALGRIRVLMPNEYDIYMHDTNHPEFFKLVERTASSGCIRLSKPEEMAKFVLAKNEGWSDKKMKNLIDKGKTSEVPVAKQFPVYVIYQTIWQDLDGNLVYGPDVYAEDKRLLRALNSIKGYFLPKIPSGGIIVDKGGNSPADKATALASAH